MWKIPRYQFAKESEPALINFIKVAKEQATNRNCDLEKATLWQTILPLVEECKNANETQPKSPPVINLCSDEDTEIAPPPQVEPKTCDQKALNDIVCTIKDNVEIENDLPDNVTEYLAKCATTDLAKIFQMLEDSLTSDGIFYLGVSLQNISGDPVRLFCHHLLMPLTKKTCCDKIVNLLEQFSSKYPIIINEECLALVPSLEQHETNIFLQYVKNVNFQTALARDFILSVETLTKNYIIIIDSLLNSQVEYEVLNKLVQLLSNSCEDHQDDKNFGKLLMHTIDVLGPNLVHVEQALKSIIAGHKSALKTKLEMAFKTSYEDSLLFSQSFRD
ncbi:uncharacterized protein LOC103313595 isoform X2 [Tribolium castaneum]|uniref:uncharacterized protein LOC103313595 isoform X2 n=1 Tax=Tribolium castaneum TaxID=7070 RepID=UPI0030FE91AC